MDPPVCTRDPSNTSGLEVLACSFDTDLNYYNFIPAKSFFIANIIFLRVVFLRSQRSKNKQIKGSLTEPNREIFQGPPSPHQGSPSPQPHPQHAFDVLQRPSTFALKISCNFSVFSIKIEWHVCIPTFGLSFTNIIHDGWRYISADTKHFNSQRLSIPHENRSNFPFLVVLKTMAVYHCK